MRDAFAPDVRQVHRRTGEVGPAQLGSGDVVPGRYDELVEALGTREFAGSGRQPQITGDQLDVEDPWTAERFGEQRGRALVDAQDLRSALRVVDGQVQRVR